jgi:hypothetical protein
MKNVGAAGALIVVALWLGYYLGYHNGVQQERRAWLATEQTFTPPAPAAATGRPRIQTSHQGAVTYYTYPHLGQTVFAHSGPAPLNQPDLRNTPAR